jgi:hypothetical protein
LLRRKKLLTRDERRFLINRDEKREYIDSLERAKKLLKTVMFDTAKEIHLKHKESAKQLEKVERQLEVDAYLDATRQQPVKRTIYIKLK